MSHIQLTNDFHSIVLNEIPLIDVRAPIEYEKGAFINSTNLPIMNNNERHLVGTCYKNEGNEAATALGHRLVSGAVRDERLHHWKTFLTRHPEAYIYCFRGGSRSRITSEWLATAMQRDITRLEGGYKAFRQYLMEQTDPSELVAKPLILGGCTGSGKTLILKQLENAIDLEGIANHRGSSFGNHLTPQPSQINFENNLAYRLIQHKAKGYNYMILEDEGRHIGTSYLPKPLYHYFNAGDLVLVEVPLEERIQITLDEYVIEAQKEYIQGLNDVSQGLSAWYDYIKASIFRVQKRLGGDRLKQLLEYVDQAYDHQLKTGDVTRHEVWIACFLRDYYDPMYLYQIANTTKKIIFKGSSEEITSYLLEHR